MKEHKKIIVHPLWVQVCYDEQKLIDENLFRHSYNPKKSLNISSGDRSSRRSKETSKETETAAMNTELTQTQLNYKAGSCFRVGRLAKRADRPTDRKF